MMEVVVVDSRVKHMGLERRGLWHRGLDVGRMDRVVDYNPLIPAPARNEELELHGNQIMRTGWGRH